MNLTFENSLAGIGLLGRHQISEHDFQKEASIKDSLRAGALSLGLMASPALAKSKLPIGSNNTLTKTLMAYSDYAPKVTLKDVSGYSDLMRFIRGGKLPIDNIKVPIYTKRF